MEKLPVRIIILALLTMALLTLSCSGSGSQSSQSSQSQETDVEPGTDLTPSLSIECDHTEVYLDDLIWSAGEDEINSVGLESLLFYPLGLIGYRINPSKSCNLRVTGGNPPYELYVSFGGSKFNGIPENDLGTFNLLALPAGSYDLEAEAVDANNWIAEATKEITYSWKNLEEINKLQMVAFADSAKGFNDPSRTLYTDQEIKLAPGVEGSFTIDYFIPKTFDLSYIFSQQIREVFLWEQDFSDNPLFDQSVLDQTVDQVLGASLLNQFILEGLGRYSIEWDFGDDTTVSENSDIYQGVSSFTHTYATAGNYTIQVRVTDRLFGMIGTAEQSVEVVAEPEEEPSPAITASLLMEAIEAAAEAVNAVPAGSPPELVQNKRLRARTSDYQPGLDHFAEGDLQLEANLDDKTNPVSATLKIEVYETEGEALAAGRVTESPVSDNYPTFEDYVEVNGSGFNGYTTSVTIGSGTRQYLFWTKPFKSGGISGISIPSKSTAIHTRVIELDGVWFVINVRAWSSVSGDQDLWDNYTQRSNDLADALLKALKEKLQPPA